MAEGLGGKKKRKPPRRGLRLLIARVNRLIQQVAAAKQQAAKLHQGQMWRRLHRTESLLNVTAGNVRPDNHAKGGKKARKRKR